MHPPKLHGSLPQPLRHQEEEDEPDHIEDDDDGGDAAYDQLRDDQDNP